MGNLFCPPPPSPNYANPLLDAGSARDRALRVAAAQQAAEARDSNTTLQSKLPAPATTTGTTTTSDRDRTGSAKPRRPHPMEKDRGRRRYDPLRFTFKPEDNTLRPRKKHQKHTKQYRIFRTLRATLGSCTVDMREVVKLPSGVTLNEWVAVHLIDFYNDISLLFGSIGDVCTKKSCPVMRAGHKYTYLWADGVFVVEPIKLSAPKYVDHLMEWVDAQISDERLFPSEHGAGPVLYPPNFLPQARHMLKRLFRVYAHMYHDHFDVFVALTAELHLNACFKRFAFFVREFGLVKEKELAPLRALIDEMLMEEDARSEAREARAAVRQKQLDALENDEREDDDNERRVFPAPLMDDIDDR